VKIILKKTGEAFDCPRGTALALIETGTCEEWKEPVPAGPSFQWGVSRFNSEEPYIIASGLGQTQYFLGKLKEPPKFLTATCPRDVFDSYLTARSAWNPTTARPMDDGGVYAVRQINEGDGMVFVRK